MEQEKWDKDLRYKIRVRIYKHDLAFGPGVAELMEYIDETRSLSEACRKMERAYCKGWRILKRSEDDFGFPLTQGTRGGKNGGKMLLTKEGKDLLLRYRKFEQAVQQSANKLFQKYMLEENNK